MKPKKGRKMLVTDGNRIIDTDDLLVVDEKVTSKGRYGGQYQQILEDKKTGDNYHLAVNYNVVVFTPIDEDIDIDDDIDYSANHAFQAKEKFNELWFGCDGSVYRPDDMGECIFTAGVEDQHKSLSLYRRENGGYYIERDEMDPPTVWSYAEELPIEMCLKYAASIKQSAPGLSELQKILNNKK
jgi:hypothetical protein